MKFSDLDLDIPTSQLGFAMRGLVRAQVQDNNRLRPHPCGVYFYKFVPAYEDFAVLDYRVMEQSHYQKIDFLSNSVLDQYEDYNEFLDALSQIENEEVDWKKLWEYKNPYQLSKYHNILKKYRVTSIMDIALVLGIIRPGAKEFSHILLENIHSDKLKADYSENDWEIVKESYGVPIFEEQFVKLGIENDDYLYKKPHAIGYAYMVVLDFLKNTKKA